MSLGCCGARAYLDILTDDVAVYAVPGSVLGAFTERVEALSRANAIEGGESPSVQESLAAMQLAG